MTDDDPNPVGYRLTTRQLELLAVGLAIVVALVHMFHPDRGVARLALLLTVDPGLLVTQPRVLAFVFSGLLLLTGASALALGLVSRRLYVGGMVLSAVYALGYVAWHLTGHGQFLPGRETPPDHHTMSPTAEVLAHLAGNPLATTALVAEVFLFLACLSLYFRRD